MEDVTFGGFPNETACGLCTDFWATGARLRKSDAEAREKASNNVEDVTFGGFPNETACGLCADFWATGARLRKSDAEAREKSQSPHPKHNGGTAMKRLRGLIVILSAIAAMFITTGLVRAANDDANVNFNVQAQIPDNQIDKKQSYFDLKMNPGQTQTVSTIVQNTSDKDMRIKNEIHTAHTNENGQIEYVTESKKQDSSLKVPLKKITQLHEAKVITVPANSKKTVSATIRVPDNAKTGVILGAWYFERIDAKQKDRKTGVTVHNKYSYAVAMKLTVNHEVSAALKLNDVKPGLRNYKKGVFANLQNTAAVIIPNLTVQGKIYPQGSDKVVKQAKLQQMIMAPNSNFDFPILFGGEELKPGKYTLKMTAKNENDTWHFKRHFTIRASDANRINDKSLDKAKPRHPGWYMVEGAGAVIILGAIIGGATWWFRRRR